MNHCYMVFTEAFLKKALQTSIQVSHLGSQFPKFDAYVSRYLYHILTRKYTYKDILITTVVTMPVCVIRAWIMY